jgi:hypothetical protein
MLDYQPIILNPRAAAGHKTPVFPHGCPSFWLLAPGFLNSSESLTEGVGGGRRRRIRGRRKNSDEFNGDQGEKHEQIDS